MTVKINGVESQGVTQDEFQKAFELRHPDQTKYDRLIHPSKGDALPIIVDIYSVFKAFNVTCPACQHAIKKLMLPGERGKGSRVDDLNGAAIAVARAITIAKQD